MADNITTSSIDPKSIEGRLLSLFLDVHSSCELRAYTENSIKLHEPESGRVWTLYSRTNVLDELSVTLTLEGIAEARYTNKHIWAKNLLAQIKTKYTLTLIG